MPAVRDMCLQDSSTAGTTLADELQLACRDHTGPNEDASTGCMGSGSGAFNPRVTTSVFKETR